ncbi:MAG: hypothetical protein ACK496_07175 [Acidobacteriota bacterium]
MNGARTYRQKIENGRVVVRSNAAGRRSDAATKRSGKSIRADQAGRAVPQVTGQSVIVILIGFGLLVTLVNVFSLRDQNQIRVLGMNEANLKGTIHRLGNAQQAEMLEKQRALNDVEKMALLDPELTASRPELTASRPELTASRPEPVVSAVVAKPVVEPPAEKSGQAGSAKRREEGKREPRVAGRSGDRPRSVEASTKRKSSSPRAERARNDARNDPRAERARNDPRAERARNDPRAERARNEKIIARTAVVGQTSRRADR